MNPWIHTRHGHAVALVLLVPLLACGRDDDPGCEPGALWDAAASACVELPLPCGSGTSPDATGGRCVADEGACGPGTLWNDIPGHCVADAPACGPGTLLDPGSDQCVAGEGACGPGVAWNAARQRCVLGDGVCGPGAALADDGVSCVASPSVCGAFTRWDEAQQVCLADPSLCGTGTTWNETAGGCLPAAGAGTPCGAGTHWDASRSLCMPDVPACGPGTAPGPDDDCLAPESLCAPGTVWNPDRHACVVSDGICAPGTAWRADLHRCVPTDSPCGAGTRLSPATGRCVPSEAVCGEGTVWHEDAQECRTDGLACGRGTAPDPDSGTCIPAPDACGPGTLLGDGNRCVPDAAICGAGTAWDPVESRCVVRAEACLAGTWFNPVANGCVPSEEVCGSGTVWVPELQRCYRGHLLHGDCEDPPSLGNIREDTILPRGQCFLVDGARDIFGATLSVEAGVTLIFAEHASLTAFSTGVLRTLGNADDPVRLTGATPTPGWWQGVRFDRTYSHLNVMEHTIVEFAGSAPWADGTEHSRAGIFVSANGAAAHAAFRHVTSRDNIGIGLSVESAAGAVCAGAGYAVLHDFRHLTVTANSAFPLRIHSDLIEHVDLTSSLTGNGQDAVDVYGGCREVVTSQTWQETDVPLHFGTGTLLVTAGTVIDVEPGFHMRFLPGTGLDVRGAMRAHGTSEAPIILEGLGEGAGTWRGVRVGGTLNPPSHLEHVQIRGGGGGTPWVPSFPAGLTLSSEPGALATGLQAVTVSHSAGAGLLLHRAEITLTAFADNVFRDNATFPVVVNARLVDRVGPENQFTGNGSDVIRIASPGTGAQAGILPVDAHLMDVGVPWEAGESLRVRDGSTLTVHAGTTIRFDINTWFRAGEAISPGYFRILGTADAPVRMVGTTPTPGWWNGFHMANSLDPLNVIRHLTVQHAGGDPLTPANVHLTGNGGSSRLSIEGLHMADSLGAGLHIDTWTDVLACEALTWESVETPVTGATAAFVEACGPIPE